MSEEEDRQNDEAMSDALDDVLNTVENPATLPEGAPGSICRRAWELGQRLRVAEALMEEKRSDTADASSLARLKSVEFVRRNSSTGSFAQAYAVLVDDADCREYRVSISRKEARVLERKIAVEEAEEVERSVRVTIASTDLRAED